MNWTQEDKLYMYGRRGHEVLNQELEKEGGKHNTNVCVLMYETSKLKTIQLSVLKSS